MRYRALFIILLLVNQGFSQSGRYRQYTTKDGLSSDMVYCAIQDDEGFMWFGTDAGLSRFDGYEFVNYSLQDGLPDHEIINFFKDSKGRIWLQTINGKVGYILGGKIFSSQNTSYLKQLDQRNLITNIFEIDTQIYFSGSSYINVLSGTDVKQIYQGQNINFTYALPIKDSILIFNNNRIFSYKNELEEQVSWDGSFDQIKQGLLPFPYHHVLNGDKVYLALLNEEFICTYDIKKKRLEFHEVSEVIYNLIELGDRKLASSKKGIFSLNTSSIKIDSLLYAVPDASNYYEDRDQNIWITTLSNGVFLKNNSKIRTIELLADSRKMRAIEGYLYVQIGNDQVKRLDSTGYITEFASYNLEDIRNIYDLKSRPLIQTSHNIYYGNQRNIGNYFRAFAISDSAIFGIKRNVILAMDYDLLFNQSILEHEIIRGSNYNFRNAIVFKPDSLFFTTDYGLFYFDGKLVKKPKFAMGDFNYRMNQIVSFSGYLAIGTSGNGLILIKDDKVLEFNTEDGLSSNVVNSLYPNDSILWVANKSGLDRIELKNGEFQITSVNHEDGLPEGQVFDVELFGEKVYVSSSQGLSYFGRDVTFVESNSMPLLITSVYADNQLIANSSDYTFSSEIDDFQIDYTAILYQNKRSVKFRHQLKEVGDLADNWRETDLRQAYYSNQKPGNYEFQLQCKTKNSEWSDIKKLPIVILIPFWKTWWFQIVVTICLFYIVLYAIYRFRKARDLRERLDRDRIEAEIKALKAQINPHFLFNALSSIQRFIIKDQKGEAEDYLADYGQLIRRVLDHSDQLTVPLQEEIETLKLYVEIEQLRTGNQFSAKFNIEPDIDPYITNVPCMIVQPLIENAIWHGIHELSQDGEINVNVIRNNDQVMVTIQDNGVGFKSVNATPDRKSYGSKLVKERLQLLNRFYNRPFEFQINSKPGMGTTATITFPADL